MKKVNAILEKRYQKIATLIRKRILTMHAQSCSSHVASSLSVVDILVALYFNILKISVKNYRDKGRDRLILSKGHAASALYATLAMRGFFPEQNLADYCIDGGKLPAHSTMFCAPGVEVSTGSLGHGLSMGIGMAMAAKYDKTNYRTFVILSDGECNEGSVWEAALFAGHHKLDNLIAVVDYNKLQALGRNEDILRLEPFSDKWRSFGWQTQEVDGHNFRELIGSLSRVPFKKNKPSIIIAHTIKGKGVSFMENKLLWHYKSPDERELELALKELDSL
jgi:transketolase